MVEAMEKMLYKVADLESLDGDFELDRGVLVPMTNPKRRHGRSASRLDRRLGTYVEAQGLGEVYTCDTGFVLEEDPEP